MPRRAVRSQLPVSALCMLVGGLALTMAGCTSQVETKDSAGDSDLSGAFGVELDGFPEDLTSDEVCQLLDEEAVSEMLDAKVSMVTPGGSQPDCTWFYELPSGPATTLQVQVMSMSQTSERLGTEALDWARDRAPADVKITEVASLGVPNMVYEFGTSTVVFAIDSLGRVFTVATHSESPEESRASIVESVLAALAERHS